MKTKKEDDFFLCYAIGRRGVTHAWGKGKTQEEAMKECELAVKESLREKPSKWRHAPYAYVVGHNDWWSLKENSIADRLQY
jgi:hypothetical protein|tara:strand:+ start:253 stop:495 length:243 start_codon:yes stop_codon:yes gene_type:complete